MLGCHTQKAQIFRKGIHDINTSQSLGALSFTSSWKAIVAETLDCVPWKPFSLASGLLGKKIERKDNIL
jgi:hypothetical protein